MGEELAKTLKNISIFLVCAAVIYLLLTVAFRLVQKERPPQSAGALPNRESGQMAGIGVIADSPGGSRSGAGGSGAVGRLDDLGSRGLGRPDDLGILGVSRPNDLGSRGLRRPNDASSSGFVDTAGYWVYLGQFSGRRNRWLCKNFDIPGLPAEGQEIVSLADLFIWDDLPCLRGRDWKLGMIMGLVPSSVPVLVVKVQEIGSGIYWALIRQ
jgi:hypothetical protein